MPSPPTPDDPLGLAHAAHAGPGRGLCLDLLIALNDNLLAQGITGRPAELQRRYGVVMAGRRPCPRQGECQRHKRAAEQGKRFVGQGVRQLRLW